MLVEPFCLSGCSSTYSASAFIIEAMQTLPTFQAFCGNIPCDFSVDDVIQSFAYHDLPVPFKSVVHESKGNSAGRDKYAISSWHSEHNRDTAIAKGNNMQWVPGVNALVRLLHYSFLCVDAFYCCHIIFGLYALRLFVLKIANVRRGLFPVILGLNQIALGNICLRGNDVSLFGNDMFLVGSYMLLCGNAQSEQGEDR